jgi:hypothetical protein
MQESDVYKTAYESQYNPQPTATTTAPTANKLRFDDDEGEQYEYKPAETAQSTQPSYGGGYGEKQSHYEEIDTNKQAYGGGYSDSYVPQYEAHEDTAYTPSYAA